MLQHRLLYMYVLLWLCRVIFVIQLTISTAGFYNWPFFFACQQAKKTFAADITSYLSKS